MTPDERAQFKAAKPPDEAKARLIARGFMDPGAWEGKAPTSSPTTTQLPRSVLATMSWPAWTSDIARAFLRANHKAASCGRNFPQECLQLLGASADTRTLLPRPCHGQIDDVITLSKKRVVSPAGPAHAPTPHSWYKAPVDKLPTIQGRSQS